MCALYPPYIINWHKDALRGEAAGEAGDNKSVQVNFFLPIFYT